MYKVRLKCLVGKSEWIRCTFKKERKKQRKTQKKNSVFMRLFLSHTSYVKMCVFNAQINRVVANACFLLFSPSSSSSSFFSFISFLYFRLWIHILVTTNKNSIGHLLLYITNRPAFVLCLQHIFVYVCVCVWKELFLYFFLLMCWVFGFALFQNTYNKYKSPIKHYK